MGFMNYLYTVKTFQHDRRFKFVTKPRVLLFREDEFLVSCYIWHFKFCNDNTL